MNLLPGRLAGAMLEVDGYAVPHGGAPAQREVTLGLRAGSSSTSSKVKASRISFA
jgi:hypothetical protein